MNSEHIKVDIVSNGSRALGICYAGPYSYITWVYQSTDCVSWYILLLFILFSLLFNKRCSRNRFLVQLVHYYNSFVLFLNNKTKCFLQKKLLKITTKYFIIYYIYKWKLFFDIKHQINVENKRSVLRSSVLKYPPYINSHFYPIFLINNRI